MVGSEREQESLRLDPLFASKQKAEDPEGSREEILAQLRRMKGEKSGLEEEFEAATHRWHGEKRRLQTAVEILRGSVEGLRGHETEVEQLRRRFEETQRYNRQLELKCEEQAAKFESEEKRFRSHIEDLEGQLVELLDRSGNHHRAAQAMEERAERELDAKKRLLEVESERRRRSSEIEWQKERRSLELEIEKLQGELAVLSTPKVSSLFRNFLSLRK